MSDLATFFEEPERDMAALVLEVAILLGWDALIGSNSRSALIEFSHNDLITVHTRKNVSALSEQLQKFGLMPK